MVAKIGSVTPGAVQSLPSNSGKSGISNMKKPVETGQPFVLELSGSIGSSDEARGTTPADAVRRYKEAAADTLRNVVEKLITGQKTGASFLSINIDIVSGSVGGLTQADAASAVSDNGEWGVEAVSDRIVAFAKSLSGDDPSHIETLRAAIDKGFASAKKALGGTLPDVSMRTYDAVMSKLDAWADDGTAPEK
jgi:hypothetical protein